MDTVLSKGRRGSLIPRKEQLMLRKQNPHADLQKSKSQKITIQGTTIQLEFAAEQNTKAPAIVRDILKCGWLRQKMA